MNIAEKNGQPSMEEILASIRRIVADEPQGSSPIIDLRGTSRPLNLLTSDDDLSDFKLPAIFRPQPAPGKPTPLFGRLTDAIRNASGSAAADLKQVRGGDEAGFDPYLAPAPHPAALWPDSQLVEHIPNPPLSALNVARLEPRPQQTSEYLHIPAPAVMQPFPAPHEAQPHDFQSRHEAGAGGRRGSHQSDSVAASSSSDVKREMVPFRDTRMSRMGVTESYQHTVEATAALLVKESPAGANSTVDFSAIIPGLCEPPASALPLAGEPWREAGQAAPPMSYMDLPVAPSVMVGPEPAPSADPYANTSVSPPTGSVEDATADLLRPMLRQWLAENMPRMVEKALHIEVAESVRTGRRPAGQ